MNPINCAWGQKAFTNYLGENKADWEEYDATCLVAKFHDVSATILIDQVSLSFELVILEFIYFC